MGMLFYPGGGTTILPVPDGMRNRNQFGNHQSCFHRCQLPKIVDFKTTSKPRQRAKPSSQLGTRWHQCLGAWCGVMQCLRSTQGRIRVIATLLRLGMSWRSVEVMPCDVSREATLSSPMREGQTQKIPSNISQAALRHLMVLIYTGCPDKDWETGPDKKWHFDTFCANCWHGSQGLEHWIQFESNRLCPHEVMRGGKS